MRIFREASRGDAIRGETQVWTIETSTHAEAMAAWSAVRDASVADFLNWNEGADKPGVTFAVDSDDVSKMKMAAKNSRTIDPKSDL